MKDDLNELWEQTGPGRWLDQWRDQWLEVANTSGIRQLQKFANTLASRRQSLLAWYDYPIAAGPLEAVNNNIRLLQRQAFGDRDFEFFRLKLYALHRMSYALVG